MKIAFVGKGGSGKTTLAALFTRYLASQGKPVLAIDADINQNLGHMLGVSANITLPTIGHDIKRIKEYLRGTNPLIANTNEMIKTTPPGSGSNLITIQENNPLYDYFTRIIEGVRFMAVGSIDESGIGTKCYHAQTGAVELLLNHLKDTAHEYVVVDMTAGADAFSSGLFTKFDLICVVVEPTLQSIGVYSQYSTYAKGFDVHIATIGNKIETEDDVLFLEKHIGEVLTSLPFMPLIKQVGKGKDIDWQKVSADTIAPLTKIQTRLDAVQKNWPAFYRHAAEFHRKNAISWGNAAVGKDITNQIDPVFIGE